ncbi:MAG: nucleoside triphosphate pyrophosphohydrolase, partial [Actinomycetota bacterium]
MSDAPSAMSPGAPLPAVPGVSPRVALVETSDLLPGLLPFQAWDVLGTAEMIFLRDRDAHPSTPHLHLAGLDLATLDP